MDLSHIQELDKDVKIYGLGLSQSVIKADYGIFVGIYTGQENHVDIAIISQMPLKAQIVKKIGGIAFIIIFKRILNIQERRPVSPTARNWEFHIHPMLNILHIQYTQIVRTTSSLNGSCRVQHQSSSCKHYLREKVLSCHQMIQQMVLRYNLIPISVNMI
jgi:hypothetical protein